MLKEIHKLDRVDEQQEMFRKKRESEMDIQRDQFYIIKRGGLRNIFKGQLCRIHSINPKNGTAVVLTLTPYRSLFSREIVAPHRITTEEYEEAQQEYLNEQDINGFKYFQGLLMLTVPYERLAVPKPKD